jgi:murein DD-endopeptidase MepM/ murein hydrolase activator NlpD
LIKIVPPWGYRVFRLEFRRRDLVLGTLSGALGLTALGGAYVANMAHAEARVGQLRSVADDQRSRLEAIDHQATQLDTELQSLEKQNQELRKIIGVNDKGAPKAAPASSPAGNASDPRRTRVREESGAFDFSSVAEHIERLRADSARVRGEGDRLRTLTLRILNMQRLEEISRARVLATIPSINPGGNGVGIRSPYGWRIDPWPEFHQGVDLDLDYGDPVRAAAAGTVVAAGYDGGYGNKIDIDHGNGYHTWYCHLEKIDVAVGQYVTKAEHIAEVGSTGESTGPHLHYQVMLDGTAVDPTPYLTGVPAKVLASLK